jgi:hypothetical protein
MKLLEIACRKTPGVPPAVEGLLASRANAALAATASVAATAAVTAAVVAALAVEASRTAEIWGAKYATAAAIATTATILTILPMRFPYNVAMDRMILAGAAIATAWVATSAEARNPIVLESSKSQATIVGCLADQIRQFDNPNVAPASDGSVNVTTHVMHVTRINISVTRSEPTTVRVYNRMKGKLAKIVTGCV